VGVLGYLWWFPHDAQPRISDANDSVEKDKTSNANDFKIKVHEWPPVPQASVVCLQPEEDVPEKMMLLPWPNSKQGQLVGEYAKKLFPDGIEVAKDIVNFDEVLPASKGAALLRKRCLKLHFNMEALMPARTFLSLHQEAYGI